MTVKRHLVLLERQLFARRDAELPFDQVEAGDTLGHWMLDLQARVHLHEPEAVWLEAADAVGDEFDGAGAHVIDRARGGDRGLADLAAQVRAHARRRRLLDHLLMPPLQRAIALAEMDGVAMLVAEHLEFDVARACDVLLDQHAGVAEG